MYQIEKQMIIGEIRKAFSQYAGNGPLCIRQKTEFDLVTEIDCNIEEYLSARILEEFPDDHILGEETSASQQLQGRVWTIDPIDGTCNMAHGIPLFGVQVSLIDEGEISLSVIYLPFLGEMYHAVRGEGAWLNDQLVSVHGEITLNNAIVSFGDYPHHADGTAEYQHRVIQKIYPHIAKIRMFGSACIDFSFVGSGKTDGTVVITKNLWDIVPGILFCREAGAVVTDLAGQPYRFGASGVVACANDQLSAFVLEGLNADKNS
ncbi:MAG: inositol monophosphatase [Clostridia bacterium]|nr:inositol monophosphatase [Clostridia bacterium]